MKQELLNAGVAEQQMQVVSLGEEGVLCVDNSDVCRHLNRRVHLDIRKIGQEHMVIPTVANTTAIDPADSSIEQNATGQDAGSTGNTLPPPLFLASFSAFLVNVASASSPSAE